jgi:beta-glucosidase
MKNRTRYLSQALYPFGRTVVHEIQLFGSQARQADRGRGWRRQRNGHVKNAGKRAGDEVVQLYLAPLDASRPRAI